ncbi:MAG: Alpha-maltose-1-phosphate synthase [Syntrophomonadaceae bacterium]|nr:Alpha-maltose-1-phosphate synthase [Bacillota bacterium]
MSGIPRFTLALVEGLAEPETGCEVHLFLLNRPFAEAWVQERLTSNPRIIQHFSRWSGNSYLSRALWDLVFLGLEAKRHRLDLLYGPSFTVPWIAPCPTVVMIYDLTLSKAPLLSRRPSWLLFKAFHLCVLLPTVTRSAEAIVTCSESTREDLVRDYGVPMARIHVIYGGVEESFRRLEDDGYVNEVLQRLGIRRPYILNPSGMIPRKNQRMLIEAFARFRLLHADRYQLVMTGSNASHYVRQVRQQIKHFGLDQDVLLLPFVQEQELVALYNGAALCVYPSLYEGFGLPVLEAMACGVPVVASSASSLPELVEDAGLLVSPRDEEAWAQAMYSVLSQEYLRRELAARGLQRVRKFTWQRAVERTLQLFRAVLEVGRGGGS